ncbi:MAG TPA: hypothetical protein VNI60_07885 [Pyrinomonadaceae bacterium]|nr:hypothetical protein [Pyrinomonadaceae bacterium]
MKKNKEVGILLRVNLPAGKVDAGYMEKLYELKTDAPAYFAQAERLG